MLLIYTRDCQNHTSLVVYIQTGAGLKEVEIHGPARQEVAVSVINNYRLKLDVMEGLGPAVLVEVGGYEEELFNALKMLQEIKAPIRRNEDFRRLLENPTLERLKGFVAIKKLLEAGRHEED